MGKRDRSNGRDLGVALRHPLRRRLLSLVLDGEPPSTRQLSDAVGRPPGNVRYHLRVLAGCGAIAPVPVAPGGAAADCYRCALNPSRARQALDVAAPQQPGAPAGERPEDRAT